MAEPITAVEALERIKRFAEQHKSLDWRVVANLAAMGLASEAQHSQEAQP